MFNANFYLTYYPDLNQGGIVSKQQAINHWKQYGKNENRFGCSYDLFMHHFKNNYTQTFLNIPEINTYEKLQLVFNEIKTNISSLILTLRSCNYFKNILIISGDYPGYGGAATNSIRLLDFFKRNGFNSTKCLFFSYEDNDTASNHLDDNQDYNQDDCYFTSTKRLDYILKIKKDFDYNLVILKSAIPKELLEYFRQNNILIVYFISGIFTNDLNEDYKTFKSKEEYNKYINNSVVSQIKLADISFVNSYHVNQILKNIYNLDTFVFYSSFIQYAHLKVLEKQQSRLRDIDYAIVVSNFDRKIKNIELSIQFLKEKVENGCNVVLIGKNSEKYAIEEMRWLDLEDYKSMNSLYGRIKNIIDGSYFESANNVRIEGIMNGCNYIKL